MAKKANLDRRAAVAGDVWFPSGMMKLHYPKRVVVAAKGSAAPPAQPSPRGDGQWICLSCSHACANNMDKDEHCRKPTKRGGADVERNAAQPLARHVLAWRSFTTGKLEAP